tara:strand:- start:710 stop:1135 length:426 start_codon:yes stop_codon:yes gene_type:complete
MIAANIRFIGDAFQHSQWQQLLRDLAFTTSGFDPERAIYAERGSIVLGISRRFVMRGDDQGYEWDFVIKQSRGWDGHLKFYAVLIGAFAIPQPILVTHNELEFVDRTAMLEHATKAMLETFGLEELSTDGTFVDGRGILFV